VHVEEAVLRSHDVAGVQGAVQHVAQCLHRVGGWLVRKPSEGALVQPVRLRLHPMEQHHHPCVEAELHLGSWQLLSRGVD
jgi:hypothetical protein